MPPKPTWEHKGFFYEEKKHERNQFSHKQHGFTRFHHAGSKTPGGGGGDGGRNQYLEDGRHGYGYGSYGGDGGRNQYLEDGRHGCGYGSYGGDGGRNQYLEDGRHGYGYGSYGGDGGRNQYLEDGRHGCGYGSYGGDGGRNQYLEDGRHGYGYGSYVRTSKTPRDPKSQFVENGSSRHFDHVLASPSQSRSMNTRERLHYREQRYVDDRGKKHERESCVGLKPFDKWNRRFYSGSVTNQTEETRKRPRGSWGEGPAKLQKRKIESGGESSASVGYSSLSGSRRLGGGDGSSSGSRSYGRNTSSPRDPRPQFWENVKNKHFDDMLTPPSNTHSMNTWRSFHYGEQHYDDGHNKNYELNPIKKWYRSERFYSGDTEKGKGKKENVVGEGSANKIEETRKRPRLNWGEGLAQFEKKKREVEGVTATSAVAATPTSSIACSSLSSGVGAILHAETATRGNNKYDILSTCVGKLLESADLSSSLGRSDAMTKVLIWKTIISKLLEETQTEISSLENELKTIESESPSSHNPEALPIAPSGDQNIEKRPPSPNLHDSREDNLCETIISCNREIVERSYAVFEKFGPNKSHKIICSSSLSHENALIIKERFAEKKWFGRFKEKVLITKHKALNHLWKKDMFLRSLRKNPPTSHSNFESSLRTINDGCYRNRSSTRYRFPFPGKKLSLIPTSEMINFTSQLLSESRNEVKKSMLKTPSLILDEKEKKISMFKSKNGLVEDPVAVEKERALINPWTSDERNIYMEKFREFGKDFRKIASFLDHKTTADCVEFYYKSYKPDSFEKDKKRKGGKSEKLFAAKTGLRASSRRRNLKVKVDSQKKLSEVPMKKRGRRTRSGRLFLWRKHDDTQISKGGDSITRRSNSNTLGIVLNEREMVAADVLFDFCGSRPTEATSSLTTKSDDHVEASRDEVNVVEAKSDTNKNGDRRNLNHDESLHVEDGEVSEPTKITSLVSNDTIIIKNIMEEGDETIKSVRASMVVEALVNEVNGARIEVNVVEAKLDINKDDDQSNLNHDESQPMEVRNVSDSTKIISMASNECIIIEDIMEDGDEDTKFASASEVVESSLNEVNVVEPKSYTNIIEDQRNLNHDESQPVEDGIVSESTETTCMVSSECIIMQDIMEVGDEVIEFLSTLEIVESPVHEVNGAKDEVNIVEAKSDTSKNEDQRNLNHDESQLMEDRNVPESTEIISIVSNKCIIMQDIMEEGDEETKFASASEAVESSVNEVNVVEPKSSINKIEVQRNLNYDESQPVEDGIVSDSTETTCMVSSDCIITQDIMEEREEDTEFASASEVVESSVNEVNVVEPKSCINIIEGQRNLNCDESQPVEDGIVSESTETTCMVSSDCIIMQDLMEERDEDTKFASASEVVESSLNEVNVVEPKSCINKIEDQRNLNYDESQPVEDGILSESTETTCMVSSDCIIMQDIMEERDEDTKFASASEVVESSVNVVNVVEPKSSINKIEVQRNLNYDESQPVEDGIVSDSTETTCMVSSDCIITQDIMEEREEDTEFASASEVVESSVNEVNVVEPKSCINIIEGQRNLNCDESQPVEDGIVSESTETTCMVSSDCIIMQDLMEERDEDTKFASASEVVESSLNEVNVVEPKSCINKIEDQRNLNYDESQPVEDGILSESTETTCMVSSDCIIMQDIMEERDEGTKFASASEVVESSVNVVNVVEPKSCINKIEDQRNLNCDESEPAEDGTVSESTETTCMVSSDCITMHDMEERDEDTKFASASEVVESSMNEVNVVEPKPCINKIEDQRNLNCDESEPAEDGTVSESTETTCMVSSDCITMQDIMEVGGEVIKFVPTFELVESAVHEVNGDRDAVNVVEAKSDTKKQGVRRSLDLDESQLVEDGDVSESMYNKCIIMQDIMDKGDEATNFVPASVTVESPVNEVNDARDEANIMEAKSNTDRRENQGNLKHDEFQPVEDGNASESTEIIGIVYRDCISMQDIKEEGDKLTEFVPEIEESPMNEVSVDRCEVNEDGNVSESTEIISTVSRDCVIMQDIMEEGDKVTEFVPEMVESPMNEVNVDREEVNVMEANSNSNKNEDQRNMNHGETQPMESGNMSETTETVNKISNKSITLQDITELGDEVTELVRVSEPVEPCQSHSVAEDGLVSERLAELPTCLDGKAEYDVPNPVTDDGYGVVLYNSDKSSSVTDERATIMEVRDVVTEVVSASKITVPCETHSVAEEDILASENTLLQNTADTSVQQEITTLQPQEGNDQLHNPGISLKEADERQVKADIICSSSSAATELPHNIEQTDEHEKAHRPGSSDSEIAGTDGVAFKLFGKMIIVPSSEEKSDLTVKENVESGERPKAEDLVHERGVCRERSKRRVSAPKYLKDYVRFK